MNSLSALNGKLRVGNAVPRPSNQAAPSRPTDRVDLGKRDDDPPAPPPPPPPFNPQPGADGIGDPYYPKWGNGGYDAQHYTIDLKVDMDQNSVDGSSTMDAVATQDLSAFSMDFAGFDIGKITVNGKDAAFARDEDKLKITPADPLHNGDNFSVNVAYSGVPKAVRSVAVPMIIGWKNVEADGGGKVVCVDCEPEGARHWFPANDHPRDKASFTFKLEVPQGNVVAANGELQQVTQNDNTTTYVWDAKIPMAPYLATVQIGNYERHEDKSPNGVPIVNYFPPDRSADAQYDFGRCGEMIDYLSSRFGAYPFERYGNFVVDRDDMVGGALECQTMSVFDPWVVRGDRSMENVVAHELGHQWFGDNVSVKNWQDIFLNEGFASYTEWLWLEKTDGPDAVRGQAQQVFDWVKNGLSQDKEQPAAVKKLLEAAKKERHGGQVAPRDDDGGFHLGQPPPDDVFDQLEYVKGPLALYVLRAQLGDQPFFQGLQEYQKQFAGKNAEIADFVGVMSATSGQDVKPWADMWLYSDKTPAELPPWNPAAPGGSVASRSACG